MFWAYPGGGFFWRTAYGVWRMKHGGPFKSPNSLFFVTLSQIRKPPSPQTLSPCAASTVPTPESCILLCGRMAVRFKIPIPGLSALWRVFASVSRYEYG